jgi:hypothetical protein
MKVRDLIEDLQAAITAGTLSPNARVIMASDAEGNEINLLDNLEFGGGAVTLWPRHGR